MARVVILSLLLLLTQFGNSYAASKKEEYELQERCGKRADELFKREYGDGMSHDNDGQTIVSYTNHYHNKFNKCFVLLKTLFMPKKSKKNTNIRTESLFDINENKEYGSFARVGNEKPAQCEMLSNFCESEAQWILLVKPYMEE